MEYHNNCDKLALARIYIIFWHRDHEPEDSLVADEKTDKLVWMDLEMTGLDPATCTIIEIATIVTDGQLNVLEQGPNLAIRQPPELFATMDDWNQRQHTQSGLWKRVLDSTISLDEAEAQTLSFIQKHVPKKSSPLCGNSIWQDRRFLRRYMPSVDQYLHYRMVDVSTFKETIARWYPGESNPPKMGSHLALDDIRESIAELKYYRENFFRPGKSTDKA